MPVGDEYSLQIRYYAARTWCVTRLTYVVINQLGFEWEQGAKLTEAWKTEVLDGPYLGFAAVDCEVVQLYARRVGVFGTIPNSRTISVSGSVVSQTVPPCSPLCLSLYSTVASRRTRGRAYFSWACEEYVSQGRLTEFGANLALNLAQAMIEVPSPAPPGESVFRLAIAHSDQSAASQVEQIRVNPELRVRRSRIARTAYGS